MRRPLSIAVTAVTLVAGTPGALGPRAAAGATPAGPPLTTSAVVLASSLSCPDAFRGAHEPVLLVHGTTGTPDGTWSWNYVRALSGQGYDVCTVALPDLARADIQVSAEYVVSAIRSMVERSHGKVDVVGFSQGPLEPRWAIRFWPDIRSSVDHLVAIAGVNHGFTQTEAHCASSCINPFWQMRPDSRFLSALNAGDEAPGSVSYTSVYSRTDPFVWVADGSADPWAEGAHIKGASNIAVQDICPGRDVEHFQALFDAAYYAVVIDALGHPGPAELGRIDRSACLRDVMPGVDAADARRRTAELYRDFNIGISEHHVTAEPALAAYARG